MRKVLADRQRRRREHPCLVAVIDEAVERFRYIERCQVDAQAARVDFYPAQTVPGIRTRQQAQAFDRADELFVKPLEFDRCIGDFDDRRVQLAQRQLQPIQRPANGCHDFVQLVPPFLSGCFGTQLANSLLQIVDAAVQLGLLRHQRCGTRLVNEPFEFPRADSYAEELHGEVWNLVRLVEDDGFRAGQELDESLFFHRQIGE